MRAREYDEDTVTTGIRLPKSLHTELTTAARERGIPMGKMVILAIRDFLPRLVPVEELKLTRDK